MYEGLGLENTLRKIRYYTKCLKSLQENYYLIEINYVLSVDGQAVPSRVRLTQEVDAESTGRINGTLTLVKAQQMCVNTTAILQVSDISIVIV